MNFTSDEMVLLIAALGNQIDRYDDLSLRDGAESWAKDKTAAIELLKKLEDCPAECASGGKRDA